MFPLAKKKILSGDLALDNDYIENKSLYILSENLKHKIGNIA